MHSAGYADEIKTMTVKSASSRELAHDNVTEMNISETEQRTNGWAARTHEPSQQCQGRMFYSFVPTTRQLRLGSLCRAGNKIRKQNY